MSRIVRTSKYRHVYATPPKLEKCYSSIAISKGPWESSMSAVNGKFLAVCLEARGGGAFTVIPLTQTGRLDLNAPKICGHKSPVLDIQWNPFNENEIASASEDCTVKVWTIPEGGIKDNVSESRVNLKGHMKKVQRLAWHPSASDILASSGGDFVVCIWNTSGSGDLQSLYKLEGFPDQINSMSWNYNGSLLATTCKDKKIRLYNVREQKIIQEGKGHAGGKPSHCVFLGTTNKLFTTGFSMSSEREYSVWNAGDLSKPIQSEKIDSSSGVLMPFWDEGCRMVYLFGKGDTAIRYFEITDVPPYCFFLSQFLGTIPHRGACCLPKRDVDYMKCEVMRFYRLQHTKGVVEPLAMTVPRKSDMLQDDIFTTCPAGTAALTGEEWAAGTNKDPLLLKFTSDGLVPRSEAESKVSSELMVKEKEKPKEKAIPDVQKRWGSPEPFDSTKAVLCTLDEYKAAYKEVLAENEKLKKEIAELRGR